jgi:hypothetical protein
MDGKEEASPQNTNPEKEKSKKFSLGHVSKIAKGAKGSKSSPRTNTSKKTDAGIYP